MSTNRECSTCGKGIHRKPSHDKFGKVFCNAFCRTDYVVRWIGFIKANAEVLTRQQIADYIEIPKNTLRTWIFRINRMGVFIPFKHGPVPKEKEPNKPKSKIVKERKLSTKRDIKINYRVQKKEPTKLPNRDINPDLYKWVKVDNKTFVQRLKSA